MTMNSMQAIPLQMGDYDFNVRGIGQIAGDQILENNNAGFYINTGASLDANGEFLMFGDDNTNKCSINSQFRC